MFRALNFWLTATIACLLAGCSETSRLPEPPQPELSQAYPEVAEFLQERLADGVVGVTGRGLRLY